MSGGCTIRSDFGLAEGRVGYFLRRFRPILAGFLGVSVVVDPGEWWVGGFGHGEKCRGGPLSGSLSASMVVTG